jgi:ABC-2 type transport system permease protein
VSAVEAVAGRAGGVPASAGWTVTGLAVRQVRRGALVVTAVAAGVPAVVAATYRRTVGDNLDVTALAALAENPAIRTLFGEPVALDDPGGFTVWRTGTVVAVLLSVWGLLATTRLTRGEEEAGRWDLLLAGRLALPAVVARHLAVLLVAVAVTGLAVTAGLVAAGTEPAGAVLHGAGLALAGAFFVAAAGVAGQVFPTRAAANGATVALLGLGLLTRMLGDGVAALGWLRWLSPPGLLALTRPYQANRGLPLLVLAAAVVALSATALALAGRRDVRGGLLPAPAGRAPRRWLLGSVSAFAVRRLVWPLAGWTAGIGAYYLLIGLLAVSMTGFLADNPRFADLAAQAGFAELGSVRGYAAALFTLLAVPVGGFAAVRLAALGAAETSGHLTLLYAQPVTRVRLLAAEAAATLAGTVLLTTVAGLAIWLGTATAGAELPIGAALAGAWNVLPIALLCLGAAVLAIGSAPRTVAGAGALPAAGGFLLQVTADSAGAPEWVTNLSPFAHLAAVPATTANWPAAAIMTGLAAAAAIAGAAGYRRRDLRR